MVKINAALVHIWSIFYLNDSITFRFDSCRIIVIYGMVLIRNMLDYSIISIMFTDIIFELLESSVKVVALTYILQIA